MSEINIMNPLKMIWFCYNTHFPIHPSLSILRTSLQRVNTWIWLSCTSFHSCFQVKSLNYSSAKESSLTHYWTSHLTKGYFFISMPCFNTSQSTGAQNEHKHNFQKGGPRSDHQRIAPSTAADPGDASGLWWKEDGVRHQGSWIREQPFKIRTGLYIKFCVARWPNPEKIPCVPAIWDVQQ